MLDDSTRPQDRTDLDFDIAVPDAGEPPHDDPTDDFELEFDRDELRVSGDDVSDGGEQ